MDAILAFCAICGGLGLMQAGSDDSISKEEFI